MCKNKKWSYAPPFFSSEVSAVRALTGFDKARWEEAAQTYYLSKQLRVMRVALKTNKQSVIWATEYAGPRNAVG